MKRITCIFFAFLISVFSFAQIEPKLKTGDIVFITNQGGQGKAIQLATKSKYTHVGIVFVENGVVYVYHAVEPVTKSTFNNFLKFSEDGKCVVKRLKNQVLLTNTTNEQMHAMAISLLNKHYDIYFDWKDNEWYCSEFVWKLYNRNYKIEVGKLRPLKDFDLSSKQVQAIMKKRYGTNIPYEEPMISPEDMFNSDLLEEVKQ
ncbi:MAG TPA: YiiX family permuted papain-like enzyme [Bacteroidia bacterium]|nr:YiiX family permuted papain-like enzyme [Bacteroidia bacterium]